MYLIVSVFTIVVGALLTAGGIQEVVYQGVLHSLLYPLVGGTLGTVAGVFVLCTGISLFRGSSRTPALVRATALICIPVFVLIGFIRPLAGWPVRIVGIALPLLLLAFVTRKMTTPVA